MKKGKLPEGLLSSIGFSCALFLFLPLVVYLLNRDSVTTPQITILLCGGLIAFLSACFLTLLTLIPGIGRWICAFCQVGLIAVVVLTVFPNRTGELTGFDSSLPSGLDLLAIAKILALLTAGSWLAWRKPQTLSSISHYALVFVLVIVIVVTGYIAVGKFTSSEHDQHRIGPLVNHSDKNWIKGVARSWAAAFFIPNSELTKSEIAVGKNITFVDGTSRRIIRVEEDESKESLIVFLDGPPLDGNIVGYPHKFSVHYTTINSSDKNWIKGVARSWAAAFLIANSELTKSEIAVGKNITFVDGTSRRIIRVEEDESKESLIVFLDGPPLDGNIVGYPHKLSVALADQKTNSFSATKTVDGEMHPPEGFTRLGATKNVVVIILDSFTGYRMSEVLNEHPELREDLSGFVYYPNAIANALSTPAGVSAIITGDLTASLEGEDLSIRLVNSLKSSFLADAKRLGFTTGFISHLGMRKAKIPYTSEASFFNHKPLTLLNRLPAYLGFLTTSLTRIVPRAMSEMAGAGAKLITKFYQRTVDTDWDLLQTLQTDMERRPQASKMALNYFIDNLHIGSKTGSVFLFHSYLTHAPWHINADGNYVAYENQNKGLEMSNETSVYATRELSRLCKKLKLLGVYDSTLLIVVADHGAMPIRDESMGGLLKSPSRESLIFNPLLMVKAPGASGACRDSVMTVWLGDIAATVHDFLGVSDNAKPLFATRSLLKPEIQNRKLNVPIFLRPDQTSHYAALAQFNRLDVNGTFRDYMAAISEPPVNILKTQARVKLFSGLDQYANELSRIGWAKKGIKYRATIEINGRLVIKSPSGIVALTESKDGYQTHSFTNLTEAKAFMQKIPLKSDSLVVGVNVPAAIVANLFPKVAVRTEGKEHLGFVYVSGPSYGPEPRVIVSDKDINLEFDWKK